MKTIIKERIKEVIFNSGHSLNYIAKQIGITQSMLSQYILYDKLPSLTTFAKLCKFLNVSSDYILDL